MMRMETIREEQSVIDPFQSFVERKTAPALLFIDGKR